MQGGLILLSDLSSKVREIRGSRAQAISDHDVETAIRKMKVLGSGFNIISIGSRKIVQSVPFELSVDHIEIITLAQSSGFVTVNLVTSKLGWNVSRVAAIVVCFLSFSFIVLSEVF